jgi:hypothetical protein
MSENDLSALAGLLATIPEPRRKEIEARLRFEYPPTRGAGVVEGLNLAAGLAAEVSEEAARALREVAAVAASRLAEQREQYARADKLLGTPEARAETEAFLARVEAGEVEEVSAKEVLRDLEEIEAKWRAKGNPPAGGAA